MHKKYFLKYFYMLLNSRNRHRNKIVIKGIYILLIVIVLPIVLQLVFPENIGAITLRELGNKISQLSREEEKLLEEIIASETQVELKKEQLQSLNRKLEVFESSLKELYTERDNLKQSIDHKRELLVQRVIYAYKYGNNDIAKIVISAGDINEVVNNLYLFRNIMKREAKLIEDLRLEKEEYDRVLRKSEEKKKEIEDLKEEIKIEEQKLLESIQKNKLLLEEVKNKKLGFQVLLSEIKRRIALIQPPGLTLAGEWEMVATAYYSGGGGLNGNGITAIGLRVRKGIVAVDPRVIPLGTKLYIPGYGEALAADTGGWIKGNRIDLAFESLEECYRFGRRKIRVYLVED